MYRFARVLGFFILGMGILSQNSIVEAKPKQQTNKKEQKRWQPTPLTAKQLSILYSTKEDKLKKKACIRGRRVTTKCRDRLHYVHTNERSHFAYYKYVKNRGGGYIGVGGDQNLTFVAWARSRFVWLMDYDPVVVWVNMINRALVIHTPNRNDFIDLWKKENMQKAQGILKKEYKENADLKNILATHLQFGSRLRFHYLKRVRRWRRTWHRVDYSWLHTDEDYNYIRQMFLTKRIRVMKGDLLLGESMKGIAIAARKTGIPIRLIYTSNAEQFWKYSAQFRKNMRGLPMDDKSIIIRTIFTTAYGAPLDRKWIYIVQAGLHYQEKLKIDKINKVYRMMRFRKFVSPGLYAIHVPKLIPAYTPMKAQKAHKAWLEKQKQKRKARRMKRLKRRAMRKRRQRKAGRTGQ